MKISYRNKKLEKLLKNHSKLIKSYGQQAADRTIQRLQELDAAENLSVIHPGITLDENLEYLHISQSELAERTGLTTKHISNIVNGKASVTPETALKLEKVLGISASFWNNLEKNYQATKARIESEKFMIHEIKTILSHFKETYSELANIGFFKKLRWVNTNFKNILLNLQTFFGTASLDYVRESSLKSAFRKYKKEKMNQYTIAAWLRIGEIKSQKVETLSFDAQKLIKSLDQIKSLSTKTHSEYIPELEKILADCGVVLVCAPYLKNTHTQGATQWVSKDKVFVIIKTTRQGEDKFWFNLFHEIGHILKHGKSKTFINIEDSPDSPEEKEADLFAQKVLLPDFDKNEVNDYSSLEIAVDKMAKKYNISKSVIAGRLSYEFKDVERIYAIVNPFIERIDFTNIGGF